MANSQLPRESGRAVEQLTFLGVGTTVGQCKVCQWVPVAHNTTCCTPPGSEYFVGVIHLWNCLSYICEETTSLQVRVRERGKENISI